MSKIVPSNVEGKVNTSGHRTNRPYLHDSARRTRSIALICCCVNKKPSFRYESTGSALCAAVRRGDWKHLHVERGQHGADLDAIDEEDGSSAIHWAVRTDSTQIVRWLLREGANVNCRDGNGRTPLLWSLLKKNNSMAKLLIVSRQDEIDVDLPDSDGLTPLHVLLERSDRSEIDETVLELVLQIARHVNTQHKKNGYTPLHLAVLRGYTDVVTTLILYKNASAAVADEHGWQPLHWASRNNHASIVRIICGSATDVDVNAVTEDGNTPMMLAATYGSVELSRYLQMKGAAIPMLGFSEEEEEEEEKVGEKDNA